MICHIKFPEGKVQFWLNPSLKQGCYRESTSLFADQDPLILDFDFYKSCGLE